MDFEKIPIARGSRSSSPGRCTVSLTVRMHLGTWEEHPETLALFHIVISNNPSIDGEQVPSAEAVLAEHWSSVELSVDGEPQALSWSARDHTGERSGTSSPITRS